MTKTLDGKVAVVTGTSPNIGAGIAGGLAEAGARVVCVDVQPDNARDCAAWIGKLAGVGYELVWHKRFSPEIEFAYLERKGDPLIVELLQMTL